MDNDNLRDPIYTKIIQIEDEMIGPEELVSPMDLLNKSETLIQSAISKLKNIGLTDEEIEAMLPQ